MLGQLDNYPGEDREVAVPHEDYTNVTPEKLDQVRGIVSDVFRLAEKYPPEGRRQILEAAREVLFPGEGLTVRTLGFTAMSGERTPTLKPDEQEFPIDPIRS